MKAEAIRFEDFLVEKNARFMIPVYQRNYDWKEAHCLKLFNDIESIHKEKRINHFIGSIVDISNSDFVSLKEFVIIDGQQRITTAMLFLKALQNSTNSEDLKDEIQEDFLTNKRQNDENKLKLKPIKKDDLTFEKLIKNNLENINEESKIFKNYTYFLKRIDSSDFDAKDLFQAFKRLWVVLVRLTRGEDDPQLIFESINSTGLGLSEADLIRNFILMDKEAKEQEYLFDNYWSVIEENLKNNNDYISSFFYHYLIMKRSKAVKQRDVYVEFKEYINEKNASTEEILQDILDFSKIYKKFLSEGNEENKGIEQHLKNIRELKITVSYPYLMDIFALHENDKILSEVIVDVLKIVESYIIRRLIVGQPTNVLYEVFMTLARDIKKLKNYSDEKYFEYFSYVLCTKQGRAEFPNDEEFKAQFISKNIYQNKSCKYILKEIENYQNKEKVDVNEDVTIEHFMPQTLTKEWEKTLGDNWQNIYIKYLHTLGNISLTGYNSELSNKPFEVKIKELSSSKLELNKYFMKYDTWNEENIIDRATKIFEDIAIKMWKFPIISDEIQNSCETTYSIYDNVDLSGTIPIKFSFYEEHNIDAWIIFLIEFLLELKVRDFEKFKLLVEDDADKRIKKIIGKNKDFFIRGIELDKNIYIESNASANKILSNIKFIYDFLEIKEPHLSYTKRISLRKKRLFIAREKN